MRELKAHRLAREIASLQEELKAHQKKCQHTKSTGTYESFDGCGDSKDRYWVNAECPTCLKRWRIYSDTDLHEYRRFSNSGRIQYP